MTKKQKLFIISYIESRNAYQSALKAGYSDSFANSKAHLLVKQFKDEIERLEVEYFQTQFKELAHSSVKALCEIIKSSENDSARVSAIRDVLKLSGILEEKEPQTIITVQIPDAYRP